jgi:hypothetical protein
MTDELLIAKLDQSEDPWVERKESFDERDVRRTIVGFANSLLQGAEPAVLFLGASNKPQHPGLRDADGTQKKVHAQTTQNSYPPITVTYRILKIKGTVTDEVLAIIVPPSSNKPHFAGVSYMRKGSQTMPASEEVFRELIASQNDTVRQLQRFLRRKVMLTIYSLPNRLRLEYEGTLMRVDAHTVEVNTQEGFSLPFATSTVEVLYQMPDLPHIKAPVIWTEAEQVSKMIERWSLFHPDVSGLPRDRWAYIPDQLIRHFSVTGPIMELEAKLNPSRAKRELWNNASYLTRSRS